MSRHSDYIYLLLSAFAAVVFFFPVFQGKQPIPTDTLIGLYHPWRDQYTADYPRGIPYKNFLITDPIRQQIPWRKISIDDWQAGKIPFWNAYNLLGRNHLANAQAASLYFLNILFFYFNFQTAWTIFIFLEPVLASFLMYVYLRNLKILPAACFLGSVSWAYSGFHIAWLTWGTIVHVSLWLPLLLLSIDKLKEYDDWSYNTIFWLFVFVFSHVTAFFAGHTQIFYYSFILSILYVIGGSRKLKTAPVDSLKFWIGYIFILLVISVQLVPTIQSLSESGRLAEYQNWIKPGWFIPTAHLIQFLIPDFFGNPSTLNYWGTWNYGEFIGYIGIIPILFSFFAIFHQDTRRFLMLKLVLAGSLLLAIQNPVSEVIYRFHFPIISALQPTRLIVLIDFSLTVLAAAGMSYWMQKKDASLNRLLLAATAIFVIVLAFQNIMIYGNTDSGVAANYIVSRRNTIIPLITFSVFVLLYVGVTKNEELRKNSRYIIFLMLFLTTMDLFRFGWKFTPFTVPDYFFPETKILTFLQNAPKPFRVMSLDDRIFPPNTNAYYSIETLGGYDPVIPALTEQFYAASERGEPDISPPFGFNRIIEPHNIDSPLLPLTNLRYVLALEHLDKPFLREIMEEGQTILYEYMPALPRVYYACKTVPLLSDEEIMNSLFKNDPHIYSAYISSRDETVQKTYECDQDKLTILSYTPSDMTILTNLENEGYIVVSMYYYPNIRVKVDNILVNTERVNFLFTGFEIPSGKNTISIRESF